MTDCKRLMEERRSVNFFDAAQPLTPELLRQIVELASLAPSAFNLQPWRLIAVRSPEGRERLWRLAQQQPKVLEAPVTLIVVGDRGAWQGDNPAWGELAAMLGGAEAVKPYLAMAEALYGATTERRIKFAESNAALLAMSVVYAARCFGVEGHFMSGIDFAGIKQEFALDEDEDVVMLLALGYAEGGKVLYPRRKRQSYDELVEEV